MKNAAHIIKGSCGYIGVSKLHYSAYFMQYYYMCSNYDMMLKYYPSVVESAIEFKVVSEWLIAKKEGNFSFMWLI